MAGIVATIMLLASDTGALRGLYRLFYLFVREITALSLFGSLYLLVYFSFTIVCSIASLSLSNSQSSEPIKKLRIFLTVLFIFVISASFGTRIAIYLSDEGMLWALSDFNYAIVFGAGTALVYLFYKKIDDSTKNLMTSSNLSTNQLQQSLTTLRRMIIFGFIPVSCVAVPFLIFTGVKTFFVSEDDNFDPPYKESEDTIGVVEYDISYAVFDLLFMFCITVILLYASFFLKRQAENAHQMRTVSELSANKEKIVLNTRDSSMTEFKSVQSEQASSDLSDHEAVLVSE